MWRLDGSESGKWRSRRTGSTHSPLRDPSALDTARDCDWLARSLLQRCPIIRHIQAALRLDLERGALLSGVRFQKSWTDRRPNLPRSDVSVSLDEPRAAIGGGRRGLSGDTFDRKGFRLHRMLPVRARLSLLLGRFPGGTSKTPLLCLSHPRQHPDHQAITTTTRRIGV
jgi:hypothetical protein